MLQVVLRIVFAQAPMSKKLPHHKVPNLDLNDQIESLLECTDVKSRIVCVREIFESVGFHIQKVFLVELTALLELASWKRRLIETQNESYSSREGMDRDSCRYQSGAEVVIANVIDYLRPDESKYHSAALSAFPFLNNTPL